METDSGISICPADFLSLNPKTGFPELQDDMNDVEFELKMNTSSALLEAWKRGQRHLNQFWKVWRDQYLQSLREELRFITENPEFIYIEPPNWRSCATKRQCASRIMETSENCGADFK